jgi:acid phosphatase (class A)
MMAGNIHRKGKCMPVLAIMLLAAATAPPAPGQPYLPNAVLVEAARQLPPPPSPGSPADAADRRYYRDVTLNSSDRMLQRARKLSTMIRPAYRNALSCELRAQIDPKLTPALWTMLLRADVDAARASGAVKLGPGAKRQRPNSGDGSASCDGRAAGERPGSSYPSRHAVSGYLWALILAELRPERRADLLTFGTETGEFWVMCRVNWKSDVEQGRALAQTLFRQLLKAPDFKTDLARAKAELATASPPFSC